MKKSSTRVKITARPVGSKHVRLNTSACVNGQVRHATKVIRAK